MNIVNIIQVIEACGLEEAIKRIEKNDSTTRSYLFSTEHVRIVVETTATKFMDLIALLPVRIQATVLSHFTTLVPVPGDCIKLIKDNKDGSRSSLSAVITRLKPESMDEIRLLITH
jgi:hypothetical protein